jgi:hypothetical protein
MMERKFKIKKKNKFTFRKKKLFVSSMRKLTLGYNIMGLVDMLSLFLIQVVRKDMSFYLSTM